MHYTLLLNVVSGSLLPSNVHMVSLGHVLHATLIKAALAFTCIMNSKLRAALFQNGFHPLVHNLPTLHLLLSEEAAL